MRAKNLHISGPLIREKAEHLAKMMGHATFQASSGWLSRFKERQGIQQLRVCGESAGVDEEVVTTWCQDTLPQIIRGYEPRNIFNADETGLFYRLTPDKTLAFSGEECHGTKQNKDRVTVMVCANMDGSEKMKPLVIGKSKNPRSFKHVRSLPVDYRAQKKAWMTSEEFSSWVKTLDAKYTAQGRKVLLFVDNCSAHPHVTGLKSVQLHFFPPNTTSQLQPMDQGVIMSFKVHYRKCLVKRLLQSYDAGDTPPPVSIRDAIDMVHSAWREVPQACIANCFRKAGFLVQNEGDEEAMDETEDDAPGPSTRPDNIWERMGQALHPQEAAVIEESATSDGDNLWDRLGRHINIGSTTFSDFAAADSKVAGVDMPTDEELIEEVQAKLKGDAEEQGDEEEDINVPPPPPSLQEAVKCIDTMKTFLYSRSEAEGEHFNALSKLDELVLRCRKSGVVQQKITSYFKK